MKLPRFKSRQSGSALLLVFGVALVFGFLLLFVLQQSHTKAAAARIDMESVRALHDANAELKLAQIVIERSPYLNGRNQVIQNGLASLNQEIEGTFVTVEPLTGSGGTWFKLTAAVDYAENYQRVVSQTVREIDFFSSFNLFVDEHPVGISGSPVGAIHSNKKVLFYFPDGYYRDSVTAVEGAEMRAGATTENTDLIGPHDFGVDPISLSSVLGGLDTYFGGFRDDTDPSLRFAADVGVKLDFKRLNGNEQWVDVETWSLPWTEVVQEEYVESIDRINEREEEYTYEETIVTGTEEYDVEVDVIDYYDTELVWVDVPRYREEERTRTVTERVWVTGGSGGTSVGGDGASAGHWEYRDVEETYTVQILEGYDRVQQEQRTPVYKTVTETRTRNITETVERTGTRTVWDEIPIMGTRDRTVYHPPELQSSQVLQVPENALLYTAGSVWSVEGEIVGRVTVASEGSIKITDDLQYEDSDGDKAYLNGKEPWNDYEPNTDYDGSATLGLIARNDVIYSRDLPYRVEINASMTAATGRVGLEGVVLDEVGEVTGYNQFVDAFGRSVSDNFLNESIRRLGGITSAKRPVETVIDDGAIAAGFQMGNSVFDSGLVAGPPPRYLSYEEPRFFSKQVEK